LEEENRKLSEQLEDIRRECRYFTCEVLLTRVNSTNVLDEGLMIGELGRRMNSKVKLVEISVYRK
jgi:hypothetical protein